MSCEPRTTYRRGSPRSLARPVARSPAPHIARCIRPDRTKSQDRSPQSFAFAPLRSRDDCTTPRSPHDFRAVEGRGRSTLDRATPRARRTGRSSLERILCDPWSTTSRSGSQARVSQLAAKIGEVPRAASPELRAASPPPAALRTVPRGLLRYASHDAAVRTARKPIGVPPVGRPSPRSAVETVAGLPGRPFISVPSRVQGAAPWITRHPYPEHGANFSGVHRHALHGPRPRSPGRTLVLPRSQEPRVQFP